MKKPSQNVKNARPKRSAACKVQTYSLLQSGYYNEQRDLKRALKFSLIEAKAAQNRQKNSDAKKKERVKKVKEYLKDENKDKLIGKVIDRVIANGLKDKQTNDKTNEAVRRFTAHRKFAQNCQPFPNTSLPVDFKEKQPFNSKLSVKQQSTCPELFSDAKLTTDDFLTFLCFRDYVPLPFSLDKEVNGVDTDSTKETRKENSSDLIDATESWHCKEKALKENNKKMKLNEVTSKKALEFEDDKVDELDLVDKISQKLTNKMSHKISHKFNKLNTAKLNQMKNQFQNSPTKVNQLKSNKLTKLAKINKAKCIEKKINESKSTSHMSSKKKVDIKHESVSNKSTIDSTSIDSTIDEIIRQSIAMTDQEEAALKLVSKSSLSPKCTSPKFASLNSSFKLASKQTKSSLKLKEFKKKKDKEFHKEKKEKVKSKQQFLNTRKLRNGKFHHYQSKY